MKDQNNINSLVAYRNIAVAVRIILGLVFVVNGLNWWVKLIDPYPSMSDFVHRAPSNTIVGTLIKSGILFHLVKAVELLAGILLIVNRFVPLALVGAFPVTVIVFVVDVFMSPHLRSHITGGGTMVMSVFLMFAYIRYYMPMLVFISPLSETRTKEYSKIDAWLKWIDPQASRFGPTIMIVGGSVSLIMGAIIIVWLSTMIIQHFTHI